MPSLTKVPLKEIEVDDLGGGLNEGSSSSKVPIRECMLGENFRVSTDGKSKIKRPGLINLDSFYYTTAFELDENGDCQPVTGEFDDRCFITDEEDDIMPKIAGEDEDIIFKFFLSMFGSKKVLGIYGIEETNEVKTLVLLEDEIWIKSNNEWKTIFNPIKKAEKPVSVVQDKGVVIVAGYEKLITIIGEQAFYSGIEAPGTPPTVTTKAAGADNKAVEYPESNQDHCGELGSTTEQTLLSQSFKVSDNYELTKVKLKLKKIGSPEGNLWVEIHSSKSGTSLTKNASINIVGQGTEDLDVSTLTSSFQEKELTFTGTKLDKEKIYYLVIYRNFAVSSSDYVEVGFDCSSPEYSDGKYWEINGSLSWTEYNSIDLIFEIYGDIEEIIEWRNPTASENIGTGVNWENLSNVYVSDDQRATVSLQKGAYSKYLRVTNFGFSIPSIATINGIEVRIERLKALLGTIKDCSVKIVKGGVESGNENASADLWPATDAYKTYGGAVYKWGLSWTPADINASNFGVSISAHEDGGYFPGDARIDHIQIKVHYEISEGIATKWSLDNLDDIQDLRESSATTLMAQEFRVYEDSDATKVRLFLSKFGSPAGNIWAEIHSAQGGTKEAKNQSDNIVGEASDDVAITDLSDFPSYGWITFEFSGEKPSLKINTIYYLVVYGDFAANSSSHVKVGHDKISPTYSVGQRWDIDDELSWTKKKDIDLIFEVWLAASDLAGDYSFVVTYRRGGNYECESNPSPPSQTVNIIAGKIFELSNIPVSSETEVTHKGIYRTKANDSIYYWEATIPNSQTEYDAGDSDSALGDEVSDESYPPPAGKTLEIWDGVFWVGDIDDYREGPFKSRQGFLEQFPGIAESYYPLRAGESGRLLKLKEFNNYLYGIKDNSIWVISKSGDSYVIDKAVDAIGTKSPETVVECNVKGKRCLVFLSNQFKIEVFDGYNIISDKIIEGIHISDLVKRTLSSINKSYAHVCTADNNLDEHEYRLAIPIGSSIVPNKIIVFNYMTGNFFVDTHNQNISVIKMAKESLATRAMFYGTDQGQPYKVDPQATTDDGAPITCKFRTGWIGSDKWLSIREMFLDFILEKDKNFIFRVYSNFREIPDLELTLSGSTPSGALAEIRNIIHRKIKSFIDGSFFSFEFINADNVSWFEVNKLWLYLKTTPPKRTIKAT